MGSLVISEYSVQKEYVHVFPPVSNSGILISFCSGRSILHRSRLDYPELAEFPSLILKNWANWFSHASSCGIGMRKWGVTFRGLYKYTVLILAEKI